VAADTGDVNPAATDVGKPEVKIDENPVVAAGVVAAAEESPAATDVGKPEVNRVEMPAVAAGVVAAGTERTAMGRNGGVFHP
jgi:hypothetical protein